MAFDRDSDNRIAAAAGPRLTLAAKFHLGPVLDACGQFEVDRLAVGQRDSLRRTRGGIGQADLEPVGDVIALWRCAPAPTHPAARRAAHASRTPAAAEDALEDIGNVDAFIAAAAAKGIAPTAAKTAGPKTAACAKRTGRIALAINFAAIKGRALVLVGEQIIGAGHVAEALGRLGIVLVAIGVELFGELAIGGLDVLLARASCHG